MTCREDCAREGRPCWCAADAASACPRHDGDALRDTDPIPGPDEPYRHTISGRVIYVRDPDLNPPGSLHLSDFAHALARIARFNGHTLHRYSVASHSLMVADLVSMRAPALRASALMHDAVEAVLGDISSPLKSILPDFKALERRWELALEARIRVPFLAPGVSTEVKRADVLAYAIERRALMPAVIPEGPWDYRPEIPPNAPPVTRYVGRPRNVARWWYAEAVRLGIPEAF